MGTRPLSIKQSSAINLAGAVAPVLITLITLPLLLPLVGEARYGVLLLVWTLVGYLGVMDMGLGRATNNQMAQLEEAPEQERANALWTSLGLSVGMGLVGGVLIQFLGGALFMSFFSVSPELQAEVRLALPLLLVALPLATAASVLAGALEGRQAFVALNIAHVAGGSATQLFPLFAAWAGWIDLPMLVMAMLAGRVISAALLWRACRRHVSSGAPRFSGARIRSLLRFGGWVSVSGILHPILTMTDRLVIGHKLDMAAVTAYTVPYTMATRLSMIPGSLAAVLFPRFSGAGRSDEAASLMVRARLPLAIIMTPLIMAGMLFATPLVSWWLGEPLGQRMGPVAVILLAGIWINALAYVPYAYLQGLGRPDLTARLHLAEALPYLALLWWMVDLWGIQGAAFAWSLRVAFDALALFILAKGAWPDLRPLIGGALLVLASAGLALAGPMRTWPTLPATLFLLALVGVWAWRYAPDEIRSLFARFAPPGRA